MTNDINKKTMDCTMNAKKITSSTPAYAKQIALRLFEKQLTEAESRDYHKQTSQLLAKNTPKNPEEKKNFILKRVAQKLWTNFCVKGKDSPMLRYLHSALRSESKKRLHFQYIKDNVELTILEKTQEEISPIPHREQIDMVNRAWEISQNVVTSCSKK